jgi:hypothetical protein
MSITQFDTTVEGNMIPIPEEYADAFHSGTKVTVLNNDQKRIRKCRSEPRTLLPEDFTAFIDTRGFKFDREEANER